MGATRDTTTPLPLAETVRELADIVARIGDDDPSVTRLEARIAAERLKRLAHRLTELDSGGQSPVGGLGRSPAVEVLPDISMRAVAEILTKHNIGAVPVHGRPRPIGIVTERDVVAALAAGADEDSTQASDIMSTGLITTTLDATVLEVGRTMAEHGVRHVPVVQDGTLVGMLSMRDVLDALAEELAAQERSG